MPTQQTPEQLAATEQATGQTPVPQTPQPTPTSDVTPNQTNPTQTQSYYQPAPQTPPQQTQPPINKDFYVQPNETIAQYNARIGQKYTDLHQNLQGTQAPDQGGAASSTITAQTQPSSDPTFNSMAQSMAPILGQLGQVLDNINNPTLTGQSLQSEYNQLAQQNNLPATQTELLNMQNVMNGSEQDIRDEISKAGGFATDSQVMAMAASRNKVIMKQYTGLATQYQAAVTNVQNMMQYASTDQQTQLQKQQIISGVTGQIAGIYSQMQNMAMTMNQNAVSAAQYNISQVGYKNFAQTLQGNPQALSWYENKLQLAPGTLSNLTALSSLDTYKQQSLQMTNLLRDTQLYNAGLISGIPQGDIKGTGSQQYGTATSTISQLTGIDPNTAISQIDPSQLVPAIIQNEGSSPIGVQNNPGNIKYVGLPGQINSGVKASDGGTFASYSSPQEGQQAIQDNIQNAIARNPDQTLGSFIDTYTNTAPKTKGNNQIIDPITTASSSNPVNGSGTNALSTGSLIPPTDGPTGNKMSRAITAVAGITPDMFQYMVQGQSALTRMPAGQQRQLKQKVDAFLSKNGVDLSTFRSQYAAYNTTLQSNISRFNNTQIAEGEVSGTLKNLDPTAAKAEFSNVNIANVAKILAGQQVNDPTASEYSFYFNDLINSLGYFYAAQQGKSSAEIPDKVEAASVIQGGLAHGGIQGLQTAMQSTTLKMKGVLADAVDNSQKQVWTLFGVGNQYTPLGTKGQLSDKDYVAQALQDNGVDNYQSLLSKVPIGKIAVVDNKTEEITAIDPSNFEQSKYTRL